MNDLRFAFRQLFKNPGFTAVAVMTLGLGIGANSALFSVVNALLLQALPFPDADRLVLVWGQRPQQGQSEVPFSYPNFADLRDQSRTFERVGFWALGRANLTGYEEPELVQQAIVNADLFPTLGVKPMLGRGFLPSEDRPGPTRVAVLSHSLWERRFDADRGLLGKTVTLDGQAYEVVGVMPPGFNFLTFPNETEVWLPFGVDPFTDRRFARAVNSLGVIGRLKPGVTLTEAQAEVDTISARLAGQYPENRGWTVILAELKEQVVRNYRRGLLVLMAAVGFVLLIACANVANLLLARGTVRRTEIAIRAALGASRKRILLQLLLENLVLACLGGGFGLLLAYWSTDFAALLAVGPSDFFTPFTFAPADIRVDRPVLLFTIAVSLLTALVFGLAPSVRAARANLSQVMKGSPLVLAAPGRHVDARSFVVAGEVALALMLLIGAGLLLRSLALLQRTEPGFRTENILTARITLSRSRYERPEQITGFYQRLLERIQALPGVQSASAVEYLPLSGIDSSSVFLIEGGGEPAPGEERRTHNREVSPGYFKTMGIRLLQGRDFDTRDSNDAPKVAIINETMARRYWPREKPLGKRVALVFEALRFRRNGPPEVDMKLGLREIVGVVADVKHSKLEADPVPEIYMPFAQRPVTDMTLVVRTQNAPTSLVAAIKAEVRAIDRNQPVSEITTMSQLLANSIAQPRFSSLVLAVFAGVALVLSVSGVYGVMSYAVSRRTREWGIRMALGAEGRQLLRLAVRQGMILAGAGILAGLAGAFALTRLLGNLLYEVRPVDPLTFITVPILLALVALGACWLPARRAARVDPMHALRYE
ncbi:MAG: ABC transporter permease [Acidobacteria bacterium]|nr:MAG: ABC transporter permease [Acidobacteriota bacterium]